MPRSMDPEFLLNAFEPCERGCNFRFCGSRSVNAGDSASGMKSKAVPTLDIRDGSSNLMQTESLEALKPISGLPGRNGEKARTGSLILNADDWGRDRPNTDRTLECVSHGAISSVSAMVFMEDSERAATIALDHEIDTGLHLNFTAPFSDPRTPAQLVKHQQQLAAHLRRHRFANLVFHPGLIGSFEYVVAAQMEEFKRIYGVEPERIDGHHHMHLCSNVVFGGLLPSGKRVRRNFSFQPGEKSFCNRVYRAGVDRVLALHHRLTDFFFSLPPFDPPSRLERIFALASAYTVEIETHPVNPEEYRFLAGGEILQWTKGQPISKSFAGRE